MKFNDLVTEYLAEGKKLSPKQKMIAKQAGDHSKIEGKDFAALKAKKKKIKKKAK